MENTCNFCTNTVSCDTVSAIDCYIEEAPISMLVMVGKHFWFNSEELRTLKICNPCQNKILEFHLFYCQVEKNHLSYSRLLENKWTDNENRNDCTLKTDNEIIDENESVIDEEILHEFRLDEDEKNYKTEEIQYDIEEVDNDELNFSEDDKINDSKSTNRHFQAITDDDLLLYCLLECRVCAAQFKSFTMLKEHYQRVHEQKGYVFCCKCRFEDLKGLREHIRVHIDPNCFQCDQCQKNFSSQRSLYRHRLTVHLADEVKTFECQSCSKKFAKKYQLNAHMIQHKAIKEFQCSKCDKQFTTNGKLQFHVRNIHDRLNEVMCDVCSKILNSKSALLVHRAEHFNTTRLQCSICNKWMKNEDTLRKHLIRHREESIVIKCEICGKQSPNHHALKKHMRDQHTLERTHRCTVCEKAFKRALALKEHMTIHTGLLLYSCEFCGKTFNSSANLCSHRKQKHPVEWKARQLQKSHPTITT